MGPSLGQDSIDSSIVAFGVGLLLVIIFMLVYYRLSGIYSVMALTMNMLFIVSALAAMGATLTLPGIAGIILTIGMAVDANVIIFERVREELDLGRSVKEAINAGFGKAFSAVMDANVTTGIAGLVLLQYGTGPIRGFAVTLLIGIVSTIFTAVFFTRLLFDTKIPTSSTDKISI
ncbi:MAG: SecD/SecF family protein translocase subunit [bacterium]